MKTISLNNFSNGIQEPRTRVTGGCISSRHFILGTTKLKPYRDMETEAVDGGATLANQRLSSAIRYKCTGQSETIYALGQVSTTNQYPKFYLKATTNDPTASFSSLANGEDTTGVVIPGTLTGYKGFLFCLKSKSGSTYLVKHEHGVGTTEIGAIGTSPVNGVVPQILIHPKDNKMYIASGNEVKTYDGSSLSSVVTFSTEHEITSTTHYGNNILLGMVAKNGAGSVVGVWSGETTINTLLDVVSWGSDTLMILENIGDIVIGISSMSVGGTTDVAVVSNVTFRTYAGGTAQTVRTIESVGSLGSRVFPRKAKRNDSVFFPMFVYLNGVLTKQIWSVYKNAQGSLVIVPDRKPSNDTELTGAEDIIGLSMIGDWMWVAWAIEAAPSTTGAFYRTNNSDTYTATSSYTTLVNPGMPLEDCSKEKVLRQVTVRYGSPTGASMSFNVDYSVDGGTVYQTATAVVGSTDKIGVVEATNQTDNSPYLSGREFIFNLELTGYGEIYEIIYKYDIINTTL